MKILQSILIGSLLTACVKTVPTTVSFDASEAEFINGSGTNTITGQAFLRQAGGQVVTCAGSEVTLIPKTRYATERIGNIYSFDDRPARAIPNVTPDEADSRYLGLMRKTICDAQGDFEFTDVPDGQYFITTAVVWLVSQYSSAGGGLMSPVEVANGETKKILISP